MVRHSRPEMHSTPGVSVHTNAHISGTVLRGSSFLRLRGRFHRYRFKDPGRLRRPGTDSFVYPSPAAMEAPKGISHMIHNAHKKRPVIAGLSFFLILLLLLAVPLCSSAVEVKTDSSSQVAGADEMAPAQTVGSEDMTPIYGSQITDGSYEITVESSSSMFRITKCLLTVTDGAMTADMTLGGKGYLRLYMGTGEEAAAADASSYAEYQEAEDGSYHYTVPVEALDKVVSCAAFSERKQKWYDRDLVFSSSALPEGIVTGGDAGLDVSGSTEEDASEDSADDSLSAEAEEMVIAPAPSAAGEDAGYAATSLKDGSYLVEVGLEGGSGRATVESPTEMVVKDGRADITITWSSPNYDYMIVNGIRYEPVNESGNSQFEIPVTKFDGGMEVIADTTAMSTPHEISYTLDIRTDTAERQDVRTVSRAILIVIILAIFAVAFIIGIVAGRRIARRRSLFPSLNDEIDAPEDTANSDEDADALEGTVDSDTSADAPEGTADSDATADAPEGTADSDATADALEGTADSDASADAPEGTADSDTHLDPDPTSPDPSRDDQ